MIHRYAYLAGLRVLLRRFRVQAKQAQQVQHDALMAKVRRNAASDYGRHHGFGDMHSVEDFRRRHPITRYEDVEPYVRQVMQGNVRAMFAPETKVHMFAVSSGTTGSPKHLPITDELLREYRKGWRIWGGGVYGDHPDLMWKKTLQLSSDWRQSVAESGTPCGQISGLAAETRPMIARPMFLLPPCVNKIHNSEAKHYLTLRLALAQRTVGIIITANPSTLVELAKRADLHRESLIRDLHDGTINSEIPVPRAIREQLHWRLRHKHRQRARELEQIVREEGSLLPRRVWPMLSSIAVWTGGSVGVYLPQVRELYGDVPVRDHGLSASEGRMSIPLSDNCSAGILDYRHHYFEFIPVDEHGSVNPTILEARDLQVGEDYYILLTTSGGLYRYDIQDVIRCVGFEGEAPFIEFLNKGKNFSSITGEKLSEHQVMRAVQSAFDQLQLPPATFTLTPMMDRYQNKPRYMLLMEPTTHAGKATQLAKLVEKNLNEINFEYREKSQSGRLLPAQVLELRPGTWDALRKHRTAERGNFEEYKHPCLVGQLDYLEQLAETLGSGDVAASA